MNDHRLQKPMCVNKSVSYVLDNTTHSYAKYTVGKYIDDKQNTDTALIGNCNAINFPLLGFTKITSIYMLMFTSTETTKRNRYL